MIEAITNVEALAQKACDRLNHGKDLILLCYSADNLSNYHIEELEKYDGFEPFKIIDSGVDDEDRDILFLLHVDSGVVVAIEKDNRIWKVLD